jgi:flagellar biosynthesis/type III secretory pathway protein FliH
LTEDEQVQLRAWIFDVILRKARGKIDNDAIKRIKKAFEREEESEMTYAIERAIDEIEQRGIRKGIKEGIKEGEIKGEVKGERKGQLKVAIAMIDDGLPIETASKYSGIPADEIMQSIKNHKPQ